MNIRLILVTTCLNRVAENRAAFGIGVASGLTCDRLLVWFQSACLFW